MKQSAVTAEDSGQGRRQIGEGRLRLKENIEPRIGAEGERQYQAPAMIPAGAPIGCDSADLRGAQAGRWL
jgi:hypothetical protein